MTRSSLIAKLIVASVAVSGIPTVLTGCSDDAETSSEPDAGDTSSEPDGVTDVVADADATTDDSGTDTATDGGDDATDSAEPDVVLPDQDNDTFDKAESLAFGVDVEATLSPVGDTDFYTFEGTAGQPIALYAIGQQGAFDSAAIEPMITLYDGAQEAIAADADPMPYANGRTLFTILPDDGTYFVRIEDCVTWANRTGTGTNFCSGGLKTKPDYTLAAVALDPAVAGQVGDTEAGNDAAAADPVTYTPASGADAGAGEYDPTVIWGAWTGDDDVDVFAFQLPGDLAVGDGEAMAHFSFTPFGTEGNGARVGPLTAWITTAADPATVYARVEIGTDEDLLMPADPATEWLLWVPHPGGTAEARDFYFVIHQAAGGWPAEEDDAANDTVDGAQTLVEVLEGDDRVFFIEGELPGGVDIDHLWIPLAADLPEGMWFVSICHARQAGSGLRGITQTLTDDLGGEFGAKTGTPTDSPAILRPMPPLDGLSGLRVVITAESQAADVSSSYYRCSFRITPP